MGRSRKFQTMGRSLAPLQVGGLTINPCSLGERSALRAPSTRYAGRNSQQAQYSNTSPPQPHFSSTSTRTIFKRLHEPPEVETFSQLSSVDPS
jgi:hypothetical protein